MSDLSETQLAISTVWAKARAGEAAKYGHGAEAKAVLAAMDQIGLSRIELEYRLPGPVVELLLPEFAARGWQVISLHNFVPLPAGVPREKASGDLFSLASLDREERRLAVTHTERTMELASDLEATGVVLHLGEVDEARDKGITAAAAKAGGMTPEMADHLELRAAVAPRHLDAVSFSLERLAPRAEALGVRLGLENRFHAFQVPSFEETGILLERFSGAPIGLWYDCGHAWVQELAGLEPASRWLESYGSTLVGCHLHDAKGHQDHQAPGQGEMDWPALTRALAGSPCKVLEVAPQDDPGPLKEGAALLAEMFARDKNQQ
ncbi:MAG: sugar phosphate isomerase/epimerase, partial [Desulfarculaceae bacterium]|nr:sugar phosphate isomerase/epimerase [Desulfarculaceae bacterium]